MTKIRVGPISISRRSQGGQGTVEYVLLLIVVIALAGALLTRFFKPFDSWAKNYLGAYFYCLLDAGELPALGGQNGVGECDEKFEAFSVAGGRPEKEKGKGNEEDAASAAAKKRNRSASEVTATSGGGGGARGRRSPTIINNRSSGTDGTSGAPVSSVVQAEKAGGFMNFRKPTVIFINNRSERARGFAGMLDAEKEKAKKREEKTTIRKTTAEEGGASRVRKPALTTAKLLRKDKEVELGGYDFSLGGAVRMAFIIAIVLMLVFLIGSQLNSISKGLEK